jgi:hypothetical protein
MGGQAAGGRAQAAARLYTSPVTRKADSPLRSVSAWCADVWQRSTVLVST